MQTVNKKKYRFLFVGVMVLGKRSAFSYLEKAISGMGDVESTWVRIELEPTEWVSRLPLIWNSHSLRIGTAAMVKVRSLMRSGHRFDGAFFNHILATPFLRRFRRTTPCVDSMDVTPADLIRYGQAYYRGSRNPGSSSMRSLKTAMTRSIFRQASYLFPYSEFTRQSLIEDYNIPEERIVVLPPGTDFQRWNANGHHRSDGTAMRVLFIGSEFQRKGGDIILSLAQREEFRSWQFDLVTRSQVTTALPNVTVHTNLEMDSDGLLDLYRRADVFVMPTRADFAPTNSVSEAMAMGLPVITTPVGGLDEVIQDGETGYIVPVNELEPIARRLVSLSANPDLRMHLGSTARGFALSHLNAEKNARDMVECMIKAVDAASGAVRQS
jgi:glycosyltransferase involved in cell wall biosynthesis